MLLTLNHKTLAVYQNIRILVKLAYLTAAGFPNHEKFGLSDQLRRAVISIKLNLAEGSARRSVLEQLRFCEIARSSLVEVDSVIETALDLEYLKPDQTAELAKNMHQTFAMLSKMIDNLKKRKS